MIIGIYILKLNSVTGWNISENSDEYTGIYIYTHVYIAKKSMLHSTESAFQLPIKNMHIKPQKAWPDVTVRSADRWFNKNIHTYSHTYVYIYLWS